MLWGLLAVGVWSVIFSIAQATLPGARDEVLVFSLSLLSLTAVGAACYVLGGL